MAWLCLVGAGLIEIVWVLALKYASGYQYIFVAMLVVVSFCFLTKAFNELPVGVAYTVFTGIGTLGLVIFDFIFVEGALSIPKIICILLIISGVFGLKLLTDNDKSITEEIEVSE